MVSVCLILCYSVIVEARCDANGTKDNIVTTSQTMYPYCLAMSCSDSLSSALRMLPYLFTRSNVDEDSGVGGSFWNVRHDTGEHNEKKWVMAVTDKK